MYADKASLTRDAACVSIPDSCPGFKKRSVPAQDVEIAAVAYSCHRDCNFPWTNCVMACQRTGGKDCKRRCNCALFSDPNSQCRKDGSKYFRSTCAGQKPVYSWCGSTP
jgi:hypothetical protein